MEPTAAELLAQALAREQLTGEALHQGMRPSSVRHMLREATAVFEIKNGALVPKNSATDPGDPLAPLTPGRWLDYSRRRTRIYL